jgi:hypothetical protein
MLMRRSLWTAMLAATFSCVVADDARAQDRPVSFGLGFPLNFNFAPPGARATALGGAFIGLADDATAAAANPAGMTILVEPEFSAHFRFSTVELEQPGFRVDTQLSTERTAIPSFFSVVLPVRRAAVSFFYQQESNFKANFVEPTDGRIDLGPFNDADLRRFFPGSITFRYTETEEILLDQFGVAAGLKLSPTVSVGGGIRFARADFNVNLSEDFDQQSVRAIFRNYFTDQLLVNASDRDVTFNFGAMFKPTEQFSIGGVYRQGGEYDLEAERVETFLGEVETRTFNTRLAVPDSYGVGIAVRPSQQFTLALDVARIEYSDLDPDEPELTDATEIHAGVEYVFLLGANATPLSVRGGVFTNPDHDEFSGIDSGQVHGTFGLGLVVAQRFQVDWAFNLSSRIREALVSFVARF